MLQKHLIKYIQIEDSSENLTSPLSVGTINYTMAGLISTIAVICLGTCLYSMQISTFYTALPVVFKNIHASDTIMAVFMTTIPQILNMVINPIVSFKSDRYRSKFGRRMPFLWLSTPCIALFLIGIGWIFPITEGLKNLFPFLPDNLSLIILGILIVGYQIFFMILGSIIYYVFPDVIPEKYIGRFMALFQLSGSLAGFIFSRYLLKYVETNMEYLFTGVGVAFFIMMIIMLLSVKEGEYPAIHEVAKASSLMDDIKTYCRECYSIPFYFSLFAMVALSEASMITRNMFNLIYARDTLKISVEYYGIMLGWGGLVGVILGYPVGLLVDKFGAIKVFGAGLFLVILVNLWSFFFVKDTNSFYLSTILVAVVYCIQFTSTLPMYVAIFPKALYGQFSSATALFRAGFVAIIGLGGGVLFDYLQDYQYIFAWDFLFTLLALLCFFKLYSDWKKLGGHTHYKAPTVND